VGGARASNDKKRERGHDAAAPEPPPKATTRWEGGVRMADDFGDETGQRLYDLLLRIGSAVAQRSGLSSGELALRDAAQGLESALAVARDQLRDAEAPASREGQSR
jgi:hypothetical protein